MLRTRDVPADRVSCGGGPDFVIVDATDTVAGDCDRVEAGKTKRAVLARTTVVRPVKGTLGFSPTRIRRTVPLKDLLSLPLGSEIDASDGSVRIQTARGGRRRQQRALLTAGVFQVLQSRSRRPLTKLVLKGGNFRRCVIRRQRPGLAARAP